MPIKTEVKDHFLLGTLYFVTVLICIHNLFYLNLTWEFLSVPLMFAIMWSSHKFGEKAIGLITGGVIGAITGGAMAMRIELSVIWPVAEIIAGIIVGISAGIFAWLLWKGELTKTIIWGIAGPPVAVMMTGFVVGYFKVSMEKTWGIIGGIAGLTVVTFAVAVIFLTALAVTVMILISATRFDLIIFIGKIYPRLMNLHVIIFTCLAFPPLIIFLLLHMFRSSEYLNRFPVGCYVLAGVVTVLLCHILMYLYNLLLRYIDHASQNEKKKWDYISCYPQLLCKKHLLRPVMTTNALFYFDIQCRAEDCPHEFITGIREVRGLIGSNLDGYKDGYRIEKDKVYINLWSESDKRARSADIDVLEIRDAQGISYDHAINAVLMALVNDASRQREYVKSIFVVIYGNPLLTEGTMKILGHEFRQITRIK